MERRQSLIRWIGRGRQRSAIARVLSKPMTTTEICQAARALNPRIQLRDIWHVMQEMRQRRLVVCLNPGHVTGKLYDLTENGRQAVMEAFAVEIPAISQPLNWRKYALVARAKTRRSVLLELVMLGPRGPVTATALRKSLRGKHSIGLNPTLRALKELADLGFAACEVGKGRSPKRLYTATKAGRNAVLVLSK